MIELLVAAAMLQAADPVPDRCNAAGQAEARLEGCPAWRFARANADGRGYYDPASLQRSGDRARLMTRTLLNRPLQGDLHSFNALLELDCTARTARPMGYTGFNAAGAVLIELPGGDPVTPRPGSAFEAMIEEFCPRQG